MRRFVRFLVGVWACFRVFSARLAMHVTPFLKRDPDCDAAPRVQTESPLRRILFVQIDRNLFMSSRCMK